METREELLVALDARMELAEKELARAAVEWFEIVTSGEAACATIDAFLLRALGELWRRKKLVELRAEVVAGSYDDIRDRAVYLFALDACDPVEVPSFREWAVERRRASSPPPATMGG